MATDKGWDAATDDEVLVSPAELVAVLFRQDQPTNAAPKRVIVIQDEWKKCMMITRSVWALHHILAESLKIDKFPVTIKYRVSL